MKILFHRQSLNEARAINFGQTAQSHVGSISATVHARWGGYDRLHQLRYYSLMRRHRRSWCARRTAALITAEKVSKMTTSQNRIVPINSQTANDLTNKAPNNEPVTVPEHDDPYMKLAVRESRGLIDGEILKFAKSKWKVGDREVPVGDQTRYIAIMPETMCGSVKWVDGRPVEYSMGFVAAGFVPPPREELGDLDPIAWEVGPDGPRDPWTPTLTLVLEHAETKERLLFPASSQGGRRAIAKLAAAHSRHQVRHPGTLPLVVLSSDSYRHAKYGEIVRPVLRVVGWVVDPDARYAPDAAPSVPPTGCPPFAPADDEIPF